MVKIEAAFLIPNDEFVAPVRGLSGQEGLCIVSLRVVVNTALLLIFFR